MERLLRYIGCKNLDMITLMDFLGNIKTYCEPFGGSFNTGFKTAYERKDIRYIYNDAQPEIFNFWACAKEDIFKLKTVIEHIYDALGSIEELDDQIHFLISNVRGRGKYADAAVTYIMHEGRRFRRNVKQDDLRRRWEISPSAWFDYYGLMRDIEIYNLDYAEIIDRVDSENTLLMLDPPYYVDMVDSYYLCSGETFYHRRLAEKLKTIKSKFILAYNNDGYISSLYEWCCQYRSFRTIFKNEIYITNFAIDEATMRTVLRAVNARDVARIE